MLHHFDDRGIMVTVRINEKPAEAGHVRRKSLATVCGWTAGSEVAYHE